LDDFKYLPENAHYFDSACQSLRPQPVLDALNDYYLNFNSCGERVKYAWGRKVDEKVEETREAVLDLLKLKEKAGELNHQVKGTKPRKVDRDRLKNYLTDNPDAYLTEITTEFGCHPTTIH